jgi:hypothetical protein
MNLRCPDCCSEETALIDRGTHMECGNCGADFERDSALVTVADAEAYAAQRCECTCDEVGASPQCFERAEKLVGALIRDSYGREWVVEEVGEKDGFPTIRGDHYWDRPDEVTVLRPAGAAPG